MVYGIISFYIYLSACNHRLRKAPSFPKATRRSLVRNRYTRRVYLFKKGEGGKRSYNIIELQTNSIVISSKPEHQNLLRHAFYRLIHLPLTAQLGQQKTHRDRPQLPLKPHTEVLIIKKKKSVKN